MHSTRLALALAVSLASAARASPADLYEREEPLTPATFSGRDLDDQTEVLTPLGIVDESTFTLYFEPPPQPQPAPADVSPTAAE